jgi:hypothetical protein
MAALPGGTRSRIDVLVGTGAVMVVLIALAMLAGNHFGRTRTMNFDLKAPQVSSIKPPEWMR